MKDIHCPKDIGFENTFSGKDCEKEQFYNNCYHCWSTALAKGKAHWVMPVQDDGMRDPINYQVRCSKCGFDLDHQTWHQKLHQYDADKYCPKCGSEMYEHKGVLEQLAEKQNNLSATNKAWSDVIEKNGYVN